MRRLALFGLLLLAACASPCERIEGNGLPVILVQDGFSNTEFATHTREVITAIRAKQPFTDGPIAFYAIDQDDDGICVPGEERRVESAVPLPPLQCDTARIKELASSCGVERGKLIILTNDTVASQASISYAGSGVMFLDMKNQAPEVIQHEFAHLFGIVDEHVRLISYAQSPGRLPGPNCAASLEDAKARFSRFYPEGHAFLRGCAGNEEWYAPEPGTLLYRLPDTSWAYGNFTTWYLNTSLQCCYDDDPDRATCALFFEEYPQWRDCR